MYRLLQSGAIICANGDRIHPALPDDPKYIEYLRWVAKGNTPELDEAEHKAAVQAQIDTIERDTAVPRVTREMMLTYAEDLAARTAAEMSANGEPTTAEQLLAANIAYVRTKAVDDQIRALRELL